MSNTITVNGAGITSVSNYNGTTWTTGGNLSSGRITIGGASGWYVNTASQIQEVAPEKNITMHELIDALRYLIPKMQITAVNVEAHNEYVTTAGGGIFGGGQIMTQVAKPTVSVQGNIVLTMEELSNYPMLSGSLSQIIADQVNPKISGLAHCNSARMRIENGVAYIECSLLINDENSETFKRAAYEAKFGADLEAELNSKVE